MVLRKADPVQGAENVKKQRLLALAGRGCRERDARDRLGR